MKIKYLFYISQNYSFEILRPIQNEIWANGDLCAWFVEGNEVNLNNFTTNEKLFSAINEAILFSPDVVFVPGNLVPDFISGLKVQVFHGLEWKKQGHFKIRGCFDLYCTHGELTTLRFNQLAEKHGYFKVVETGWPKLDPLFATPAYEISTDLPVILFAPTFSPNLTCALECLEEIKKLVKSGKYYWLVKFHPKMKTEWIELYRQIKDNNFQIVDSASCLPLLQRADILISDTSSIIGEFLLLNKPAITYKNANPGPYLIDIKKPEALDNAIQTAFKGSTGLIEKITLENQKLHPYKDGKSSVRILKAVNSLLNEPIKGDKKKPFNLFRHLKLRKRLNYWKF